MTILLTKSLQPFYINLRFLSLHTIPKSVCTACLEGKFAKLPFPYPAIKSATPLEVIHRDVWGPSPTIFVDGFRYYVSFMDECTRFTWIFPMRNKREVYSIFVSFHAFLALSFLPIYAFFRVMVMMSTSIIPSSKISLLKALFITYLVHTPLNRMVLLRGSIATF